MRTWRQQSVRNDDRLASLFASSTCNFLEMNWLDAVSLFLLIDCAGIGSFGWTFNCVTLTAPLWNNSTSELVSGRLFCIMSFGESV